MDQRVSLLSSRFWVRLPVRVYVKQTYKRSKPISEANLSTSNKKHNVYKDTSCLLYNTGKAYAGAGTGTGTGTSTGTDN